MHDVSFGRLASSQLSDDRPLVEDEGAARDAQHLFDFRRGKEERLALPGELIAESLDLAFGPYVDATGWVIEDQDSRLGRQLLSSEDPLLSTAGEVDDSLVEAGGGTLSFRT